MRLMDEHDPDRSADPLREILEGHSQEVREVLRPAYETVQREGEVPASTVRSRLPVSVSDEYWFKHYIPLLRDEVGLETGGGVTVDASSALNHTNLRRRVVSLVKQAPIPDRRMTDGGGYDSLEYCAQTAVQLYEGLVEQSPVHPYELDYRYPSLGAGILLRMNLDKIEEWPAWRTGHRYEEELETMLTERRDELGEWEAVRYCVLPELNGWTEHEDLTFSTSTLSATGERERKSA